MVKNHKMLERFEREQLRKEKLTYADALKIAEALWQEGRALGVLPLKNPLDGIESDIRIAAILNSINRNLNRRYVKKLVSEFCR